MVQSLRKQDLFKAPGVAETLDWAAALAELDVVALDPATVTDTLGVLLKYQDDIARIEGAKAKELIEELRANLRAAGCACSRGTGGWRRTSSTSPARCGRPAFRSAQAPCSMRWPHSRPPASA